VVFVLRLPFIFADMNTQKQTTVYTLRNPLERLHKHTSHIVSLFSPANHSRRNLPHPTKNIIGFVWHIAESDCL
jgi:hypothetical protein